MSATTIVDMILTFEKVSLKRKENNILLAAAVTLPAIGYKHP